MAADQIKSYENTPIKNKIYLIKDNLLTDDERTDNQITLDNKEPFLEKLKNRQNHFRENSRISTEPF